MRSRLHIPFPAKVMLSYLLIVGLVFIPTIVYLDTTVERELYEAWQNRLDAQARPLAQQLSQTPSEEMSGVLALLAATAPDRLTVVDAQGHVLIDSHVDASKLDNHRRRPEIAQALSAKDGFGTARRYSASTHSHQLYVARRFPLEGPPRGIVRLSIDSNRITSVLRDSRTFLTRTTAAALSVALLLSVLAAAVFARPLRRIIEALRALAEGRFDAKVSVDSGGELAEAADALRDLVQRLRSSLVRSGAAQASLDALLDGLPCGVILFDSDDNPRLVSGPARALCDITPREEMSRAKEIAQLARQESEDPENLDDSLVAMPVRIELPWKPKAQIEGRWITLFGEDGQPQSGLVLIDIKGRLRHESLRDSLNQTILLIREAAEAAPNPELRINLEQEAERLEGRIKAWTRPDSISTVQLSDLCNIASGQLDARAQLRKIRIKLEVPEAQVVESGGLSCRAFRDILDQAVRNAKKGSSILVGTELVDGRVVLATRFKGQLTKLEDMDDAALAIGMEQTLKQSGDYTIVKLALPRA